MAIGIIQRSTCGLSARIALRIPDTRRDRNPSLYLGWRNYPPALRANCVERFVNLREIDFRRLGMGLADYRLPRVH